MKFDQNQYPKKLFFYNYTPKFVTTSDFTKNDTQKFIFFSKRGTPKKAHPVPAYMVVSPPRAILRMENTSSAFRYQEFIYIFVHRGIIVAYHRYRLPLQQL